MFKHNPLHEIHALLNSFEGFNALLMFLLGLWLLNPWTAVFNSNNTGAVTQVLAVIGDLGWGTFLVMLGSLQWWSIKRPLFRFRKVVAITGFAFWMMFFLIVIFTAFVSLTTPLYFLLALFSLKVYLRIPSRKRVKHVRRS